jgi:hypothetical protein
MFGTLSGAGGIIIVAISALFGAIVTVVMKRDPGTVLGVFVVAGTLVACLAVRARSVRLIIPAPTICYVPAAVIAGAINDRSTDTTHTMDLLNAGSWIANGFLMMALATIAAIVFTGLRLFLDWRYRPRPRQYPRPGPRPGPADDDRDATRRIGTDPTEHDQTRPVGRVGDTERWDRTGPIGAPNGSAQFRPPGPAPYRPQGTNPYQAQDTGPYQAHDTGPYQAHDTGPYQAHDTGPYQAHDTGPYRAQDTGSRRPQGGAPSRLQITGPPRPEITGPPRNKAAGPYQAQDSAPYRSQGSAPYQTHEPYGSGAYPETADLARPAIADASLGRPACFRWPAAQK